MFHHTVGTSYTTDAGTVINIPETITAATSRDIDCTLGPGATQAFEVAIARAGVQSLLMCSDQPTTIVTNDDVTPQDSIALKQNVPLVWTINSWFAIPLQGDVTRLFIRNDGPVNALVKIRVLAN